MHDTASLPYRVDARCFLFVRGPALGGLLVSPALDEDIENKALLVDRAPAPVLLASNAADDLVEVPFVAAAGGSPTDAVGEFLAEFQAPLPDRLVGNRVPRAASISSTIRKLSGNRKYSQTA